MSVLPAPAFAVLQVVDITMFIKLQRDVEMIRQMNQMMYSQHLHVMVMALFIQPKANVKVKENMAGVLKTAELAQIHQPPVTAIHPPLTDDAYRKLSVYNKGAFFKPL